MERGSDSFDTAALEAPAERLVREAERYLEAIAVFREQGHEPRWRPERPSGLVLRVRAFVEPRESRVSGA